MANFYGALTVQQAFRIIKSYIKRRSDEGKKPNASFF